MLHLDLYRGKVVNIDDPDQTGRIQIRIIPELDDEINLKNDKLPWFEPFFGSFTEFSKYAPLKDTLVWCLIDDKWKRKYYVSNFHRSGLFNFSTISTILNTITELSDSTYKNLSFTMYEDSSISFHNNLTGEHGYIHSTGSYALFDVDGNMIINGVSALNIKLSGNINIESSGNIEVKSGNVTITGGILKVEGEAIPNGLGAFCGLRNCLFTGAPHTSDTIVNT